MAVEHPCRIFFVFPLVGEGGFWYNIGVISAGRVSCVRDFTTVSSRPKPAHIIRNGGTINE